MQFENQKKTFLAKFDKSKKGMIDKEILPLINRLNDSRNYYTTSSCSGRIVLLSREKSEKKQDTKWLFITHKETNLAEIKKALQGLPKTDVWFRFEPMILHVAAKTVGDAQKLVNAARNIGFKRSGVQSMRKVLVELASTDIMDTIIARNGNLLVDDPYLKILIAEANKKLKRTRKKIKEFYLVVVFSHTHSRLC